MQDTLLIVNDNKDILQLLSRDLGKDYLIVTAENGQHALEMIESHPVRIIISDMQTPLLSGFDLCLHVKTSLHYAHIPVILLTAGKRLQSQLDGLKAGADACIDKPFSSEHLKAQISSLLNNRKKIRAYYTRYPQGHIGTASCAKPEEDFLAALNHLILDNIENTALDVDLLAKLLNISRPTLYRKIKALSDMTPNELVMETRLKKAVELLTGTGYKIFEIAMMTGFNSQSSFGKAFLRQFKMTPTAFQQIRKKEGILRTSFF